MKRERGGVVIAKREVGCTHIGNGFRLSRSRILKPQHPHHGLLGAVYLHIAAYLQRAVGCGIGVNHVGCTRLGHDMTAHGVAPCFEKGRRWLPAVGERKGYFALPCKVAGHPLFNIYLAFIQVKRGLRAHHQGQSQHREGRDQAV